MEKESFLIYKSFYEPIKELSLEHKGLLLSAIFEYQINNNIIDLPSECRMAFKFFKNQFDLDFKKYSKICEKRSNAGKKSAKSKQNEQMPTNDDKCQQNEQMLTKATDNETDTDTDTENDNENDNVLKKIKKKNFEESDSFQFSVDFGKQIRIGQNFKINFDDEFFNPYRHASPDLAASVESWIVKNKLGVIVDKNFICKQIANFAKKQGKYNELLGE